jgi:hypothetical protein
VEEVKSMQVGKGDDGWGSFVVLAVARPTDKTKGFKLGARGEEFEELGGLCVVVDRGLPDVERGDAKWGDKGR